VTATVAEAYATCVDITRREAGNFYYGIRLLPAEKRAALCAVYALARRIDDIGDGDLPAGEKLAGLAGVRASVRALAAGDDGGDPVLAAVGHAAARHPIPLEAFEEIVDGAEADVTGRRYATFDELVWYCRCVAGSVGRLCLGVFGSADGTRAPALADSLGIGLQQTNILRDVREDLLTGRVYLPQEDLDRFGVKLRLDERGALADPDGGLAALIRHGVARARRWYSDGDRLVPLLDRRSAACTTAMAGIYRELSERIGADPSLVYDRRLSLSGREKARVAVRALTRRSA
jgi:15-cis-phytoene synthase